MFGPIARKHIRITDSYTPEPGPSICENGLQLVVPYKGNHYVVTSRGDDAWNGQVASRQLVRGISLACAEFHLKMGNSVIGPVQGTSVGRLAVIDGTIAIAIALWPQGLNGRNHLMIVDVATGLPTPLAGSDAAAWFNDWTVLASFDGLEPFPILRSDD